MFLKFYIFIRSINLNILEFKYRAIFFQLYFYVDIFIDVLIPPVLCLSPSSPSTPLPSGHRHTDVCVYGLCIYVLWLIPSSSPI